MSKQEELSRFTGSGKTFFFNKGQAKNGTDYLAVNAIYGKGNQERVVLFPPHYIEFRKHYTAAVETLYGIKFVDNEHSPSITTVAPHLPIKCPMCGDGSASWEIFVETPDKWLIDCTKCNHRIFDTGNTDD